MEHVRSPRPVDFEVAERSTARQFVRAQELGVGHACPLAHPLLHQHVERILLTRSAISASTT